MYSSYIRTVLAEEIEKELCSVLMCIDTSEPSQGFWSRLNKAWFDYIIERGRFFSYSPVISQAVISLHLIWKERICTDLSWYE